MNEDKFYQLLGMQIAKARIERGISQEELGNFLELSRTSVVNIERGRQRPSIYMLLNVAKYLIVDLEKLLPTFEEIDNSTKVMYYGGGIDEKSASQSIKNFLETIRL